jgi:hypothetical protein
VDDLRINGGVHGADRLETPLPELAIASGLWSLVAEHRAEVVELREACATSHVVFDERAHRARCALRAQRETATLAVGERVHFLPDDVRGVSDAAREEFRLLEDRQTDLAIAEPVRRRPEDPFDALPLP